METNLTDKQIRFIEEYLIDLNAKQAAIRAGYSAKSAEFQGSKLLADSKVSQELKLRQEVTSKKLEITKESLIKDLNDIKNLQKTKSPQAAIKAIEVISRMLGLFSPDKIEHSGHVPISIIEIKEVRKEK